MVAPRDRSWETLVRVGENETIDSKLGKLLEQVPVSCHPPHISPAPDPQCMYILDTGIWKDLGRDINEGKENVLERCKRNTFQEKRQE